NPVLWLQMTNMISYQGLVRTFPNNAYKKYFGVVLSSCKTFLFFLHTSVDNFLLQKDEVCHGLCARHIAAISDGQEE
ncbi:hypothetical protein, partial [Escherichia coli]|uniref:hypothetical protein n=1 Tax=Escherichia coli TaxID=562 RepID=UPI001BC8304A